MILPQPRRQQDALAPYSQNLAKQPDPFEMGDILVMDENLQLKPSGEPFLLAQKSIEVHMAVIGGSGSGKSKFLELLLRQYMIDGKPFFFDPHGDTAKDLLAFAAAFKHDGDDVMWRRVHHLKVGPDSAFTYAPFAHAPLRQSPEDVFYNSWLDTKVQFLCRAILRRFMQADVDAMNRMMRWMENVLYFCGTAYDDKNSHNGLDKMLVATNPDHPEFEQCLERVFPYLHDYVQEDYLALYELKGRKRVQQREKWIESTVNNLRRVVSTLLLKVFACRGPALNIPEIMRQGGFIIADLGETGNWGYAQKTMLGGLLIQEVLHAKYVESELLREDRGQVTLVIDEVGEFLGDDLERALGATRKYNLPLILAAQNLSTFAKGDFDMAAKVLSMCQTVVCFQNTFKDDKEVLRDRLGTPNRDFTPRLVERQFQRGLLKLITHGKGRSRNGSETWQDGWSVVDSESFALMVSRAIAIAENWSEQESDTDTAGDTETSGITDVAGKAGSVTQSPLLKDGKVDGHTPVESKQESASRAMQKALAKMRGHAHMLGRTKGGGITNTNTEANTQTNGRAIGKNGSAGGGSGWAENETENETYVPNIESEWVEDGTLAAGPVEVQDAKMDQQLHTLGVGQCIVADRRFAMAFVAQVAEVREWWANGRDKMEAVERLKARLHALHPYYFDPRVVRDVDEPVVLQNGQHGHRNGTNNHANGKPHTNGQVKNNQMPD